MLPETFEFILGLIGPKISNTNAACGRKPIPAKKQLLLALWAITTTDSYRSICDRFSVGKATAVRSLRRVTNALHCLVPEFIQWPQGHKAVAVMKEFEQGSTFPQVIGVIDGTQIQIKILRTDNDSSTNSKRDHSIHVQAVCTHQLLFTDVFAGQLGCVHDAHVFGLSSVHQYVEEPDVFFPDDSHIIGHVNYGIHPKLMVPFRDNGHLSGKQTHFNSCLSSALTCVERTFGLWKSRWRSIQGCLPMVTMEKIPEYLIATCVLHNICILKNDLIPFTEQWRVRNRGKLIPGDEAEGELKRLRIMNRLSDIEILDN